MEFDGGAAGRPLPTTTTLPNADDADADERDVIVSFVR